jgi:succinate dehydrogenase hydrophobic anchor subunit
MKPGSRSISGKLMWMNIMVSAIVLVLAVLALFFLDVI